MVSGREVGGVVVEEAGDGLRIVIGTNQTIWPLTHWGRDVFVFTALEEPPAPLAPARFTIGDEGTVVSLFLESMLLKA